MRVTPVDIGGKLRYELDRFLVQLAHLNSVSTCEELQSPDLKDMGSHSASYCFAVASPECCESYI